MWPRHAAAAQIFCRLSINLCVGAGSSTILRSTVPVSQQWHAKQNNVAFMRRSVQPAGHVFSYTVTIVIGMSWLMSHCMISVIGVSGGHKAHDYSGCSRDWR
jgi:hypothetical protein